MIEIKDLLSSFGHLLVSEEKKRESVCLAISQILKIPVKKEDIKIKNGVIFANLKPIYKSEIFLKKGEILLRLGELLGKKTPHDIR